MDPFGANPARAIPCSAPGTTATIGFFASAVHPLLSALQPSTAVSWFATAASPATRSSAFLACARHRLKFSVPELKLDASDPAASARQIAEAAVAPVS